MAKTARTTQQTGVSPALFFSRAHNQIQKLRVQCQVRLAHLSKRGKHCPLTEELLKESKKMEERLRLRIEEYAENHPLWRFWLKNVRGVGKYSLGKLLAMIDITKADTVSALWRFAGYNPGERRKKGEKLHFSLPLKVHCWKIAGCLIKAKGCYCEQYLRFYENYRQRAKQDGIKIVKKQPKENQITEAHLRMMAARKMIKLFLQHLWVQWREFEGLPTTKPYAHDILGHSDYIPPLRDR